MFLADWFARLAARYREHARRAEWERLHKRGAFPRGRTETEDGTSFDGGASFSGKLSTRVIRKDEA